MKGRPVEALGSSTNTSRVGNLVLSGLEAAARLSHTNPLRELSQVPERTRSQRNDREESEDFTGLRSGMILLLMHLNRM